MLGGGVGVWEVARGMRVQPLVSVSVFGDTLNSFSNLIIMNRSKVNSSNDPMSPLQRYNEA